jgi:hypothetical protein
MNTMSDSLKVTRKHNGEEEEQTESKILDQNVHNRAIRTLDTIRTRAWKESGHW